ncbi:MAG TPA: hypothetical protein VJN44_13040 [Roseateles sp.]|nr:hypothetical protein [Roseateles sp.]
MNNDSCKALRKALLDLHRALIELERRAYEKQHGPQGAGDFLQVMAYAEEMRWLEPLSRLIVMLDEALDGDGDAVAAPLAVAQRARQLLSLDRDSSEPFTTRYLWHFDGSPELVQAHTQALAALKAAGTRAP